uniref:Uma2 family endonuclease n=1 Tax=Paractinoplanes polyasparticus TaxID=2856853 RepID=UPI001C85CEFE|nr:Uma2 family endonuclease [Actinoplanes polyasparticus]
MTDVNLPKVEDLDVDDLASLPRGYRYELHDGNLVVMTPSTYWHKLMAQRLLLMLHAAGFRWVLQDTGIRGDRPRDCRIPDLGVLKKLPADMNDSNLPASAFQLIIEVVSEKSPNGEYRQKAQWYAERGIVEYWIVDRTPDRAPEDAVVHLHHLTLGAGEPAYTRQRSVLLTELEAEFRAKGEA